MDKQKGITLIALVITIIVLLILAGVSIATLTGENGILNKASKAKEEHLIEQYKEEINLIIIDEVAERKTQNKEELMIVSLDTKIRKKEWVNEIYKCNSNGEEQPTFEASTHLLVESKEHYEFLIEVNEAKQTAKIVSSQKGTGEKYTITYHPNGGEGQEESIEIRQSFSVTLKECDYTRDQYKFVGWCENQNGEGERYLGNASYKPEGQVTLYAIWELNVATITFNSNDGTSNTKQVTVTKGKETKLPANSFIRNGYTFLAWNTKPDGTGTKYEKEANINIEQDLTLYALWEIEAPEDWQVTSKTDSEWYNYGGAKIAGPKLQGEMTPIKYIGESQEGNKWANAVTADGSMFVWVPRYAYKITSGYHQATAGTIEVAFISTSNSFLNGETGEITSNPSDDGAGTTKWLVHPAFTANATNGGGFGELEGLWIGKFEATGTSTNLSVKPGEASLRNMTINAQYQLAKSSTFGENVSMNSHMAKNSEWGVTVYLGHSKYGTNGQKVSQNTSSSYYTGGSNNKGTIYTTNKTQSTTHNATGVYDMNGGVWEYVASYINNGGSNLAANGGSASGDLYGKTVEERATSTAYKMVYEGNGIQANDYEIAKKYKGDAIYETSDYYNSINNSWFSVYAEFPGSNHPFFLRGGAYNNENTGMFGFSHAYGVAHSDISFRPVLAF